MRYDLDQLNTFLAVLELGTVTAAAERLNLSKSVVSKRITDLEHELGAALFRRNAGRIAPTESALRFADSIRPALAQVQSAAEAAAWGGDRQLHGALSIAAPMSFGTLYLTPILACFAKQHPDLTLRIDLDDRTVDISRGGYDVALRIGALDDSALMARKLCEDIAIPCAAPEFFADRAIPQRPEDLSGLPVIGYSNVSNARHWRFTEGKRELRPAVVEVAVANNGEAMRDLAIAALGIAMLPGFIAMPAIREGRLLRLLPDTPPRKMPISAVWQPVQPVPIKLRSVIDYLAAELHGAPWLAA